MIERLDHVGIAVRNSQEALSRFALLALRPGGTEVVPTEGVKIAFLEVGGARIELLEPIDDTGPVARFLARRGEGVHHIAFSVPDVAAAMADARDHGFLVIDEKPRTGHGGRQVAFVHPKSAHGVLLEFVEDRGRSRSRD